MTVFLKITEKDAILAQNVVAEEGQVALSTAPEGENSIGFLVICKSLTGFW